MPRAAEASEGADLRFSSTLLRHARHFDSFPPTAQRIFVFVLFRIAVLVSPLFISLFLIFFLSFHLLRLHVHVLLLLVSLFFCFFVSFLGVPPSVFSFTRFLFAWPSVLLLPRFFVLFPCYAVIPRATSAFLRCRGERQRMRERERIERTTIRR